MKVNTQFVTASWDFLRCHDCLNKRLALCPVTKGVDLEHIRQTCPFKAGVIKAKKEKKVD